ncbi:MULTISPECIES: S8 family peptidase [unclassified Streptomyces]|uniref:S8 family peptidase n=1 Tax=unclassified Streptomyces TaxID=2593676 RepID=UPI0006B001D2
MHGFTPLRISVAVVAAAAVMSTGIAFAGGSSDTARPSDAGRVAAPATAAPTAATELVQGFIVGYKPRAAEAKSNTAAEKDAEAKAGKAGEPVSFERRLGTGAALVELPEADEVRDAQKVAAAFLADPDVAYVVPDRRVYATAVDPAEYKAQWDLYETTAGMNVPSAWKQATGKGVTVAVLDTGITEHTELSSKVLPGYDFISDTWTANDGGGRDNDPSDAGDWLKKGECGKDKNGNPVPSGDRNSSWHGTHVAGTIAAAANGSGTVGVAHGANILPVRVLGRCGGTTSDIIDAVTWASGGTVTGVPANKNPAAVVNMSLGGKFTCDQAYNAALKAARDRGTTVVVSAGNDNTDAAAYSPAGCADVVTVAASDREGNRAAYSNYGKVVDVTAPGGETSPRTADGILSTLNKGTKSPGDESYASYQGTSMAAPHIAGLAALLKQKNPSLTPAQVEQTIKSNTLALPGTCSGGCGAGLSDATKTLNAVTGG